MALIRTSNPSKSGVPYPDNIYSYGGQANGVVLYYLPAQNLAGRKFKIVLKSDGGGANFRYDVDGTSTAVTFDQEYTIPAYSNYFAFSFNMDTNGSKYEIVWID